MGRNAASVPGLAVVVPMYNEEAGAKRCVRALTAVLSSLGRRCRLIVVEDGSGDRTADVLDRARRDCDFTVVRHGHNRGYGAALRTGAVEAHRQGYDYVLFMDSDLTNPPEHVARFLPAIDRGADVIKGCRYCRGGRVDGVPWRRYIVSRLGNLLVEHLYGVGVRDTTNGFRCVRTEVFLAMPLADPKFSVIMEEMYWAKRLGYTFANVPTTLTSRSEAQRRSSFSYKPATFYRYLRYAVKAALLPAPARKPVPAAPTRQARAA